MFDQELEHFGVKGMKWGVRRTPAQLGHRKEKKLNRYKEKEIRKVEKRIETDEKNRKQHEADHKSRKAYYKSLKNPTDQEKEEWTEAKEFDSMMRYAFRNKRKEANSEIAAIKKMSYKDMQNERVEVGKQVIKDFLEVSGRRYSALLTYESVWSIDSNPDPSLKLRDPSVFKTNIRLQRARR